MRTIKDSDRDESKHLSKKERAKQFHHEAYLRAKEYRKTDPRQIAMMEKLKEQRKDAYQKAKERDKAYRAGQKKASNEKAVRKKNAPRKKRLRCLPPPNGLQEKPKKYSYYYVKLSNLRTCGEPLSKELSSIKRLDTKD